MPRARGGFNIGFSGDRAERQTREIQEMRGTLEKRYNSDLQLDVAMWLVNIGILNFCVKQLSGGNEKRVFLLGHIREFPVIFPPTEDGLEQDVELTGVQEKFRFSVKGLRNGSGNQVSGISFGELLRAYVMFHGQNDY